jgi:MFS family permease
VTVSSKPFGVDRASPPPLRKNRDFLLLWTGAGFSQLGARMSTVAFPLLMIWHTGSTVGAGLVAFAGLLPMLVLQLPAGVMVDRWDRRRLMILCDLVGIIGMASVAVAVLFDHVWLPHLMVVAFVEGSAGIFYQLAERAAVRNVVHPDHLSTALSQNEARGRAAGLLGQPAGSSVFVVGRWLPFGLTTVGHVVSLLTLAFIKKKFQTGRPAQPRQLRTEILVGLAWVWGQRFLRAAVTLVAVSNILFQIVNLAPFVIIKEQGGPVAAVGFIGMVGGIGGVAGALSSSFLMKRMSLTAMLLSVFVVWSLLIPIVAIATSLALLFVLFAAMSFAGATMNVGAGVYMSRIVPDRIHGRALSAVMLLSWGANSIGAMAAGFLLGAFTTTATLLGVGGVMFGLTILAFLNPSIRNPDLATSADQHDG